MYVIISITQSSKTFKSIKTKCLMQSEFYLYLIMYNIVVCTG